MVSVIILAYNRCPEVLVTIERTKQLKQSLDFDLEIIVVDNASGDGTSAKIKENHPDITLVTRTDNNGIAGWNDGFALARYKYLLVLDDDSNVHSGLQQAIERLEKNPQIGILGLQIVDKDLKMDPFLDPKEAWKDNEDIAGFIGCGAIIRKSVYEKIGGFAEWLFVYTHEFEYAIRCWDAGYRVSFFAGCIVVHRVSSLNRSNKRLRVFGTRNELAIVYKYFGYKKLKYIVRITLNNLKFVKREGIMSGYYVLKGLAEFIKMRSSLKRTPVSKQVQQFYADNFWGTKPVFANLKKRFKTS
jgi:GT2 family glycosyltransferase